MKMPSAHSSIDFRFKSRYRFQNLIFSVLDFFLRLFFKKSNYNCQIPPFPKRILIANAGHLGDVIITTGIIRVLHEKFPDAEIGFLGGGWISSIVSNNSLITYTHYLDHWYLQRNEKNIFVRIFGYYFKDKKRILKELISKNYDVAIDVRSWFPNFVPIICTARIPVRVGFNRVGFSPLLTHSLNYSYAQKHELEYQFDLLSFFGIDISYLHRAIPFIPEPSAQDFATSQLIIEARKPFRILHVTSSTPSRDWPITHWRKLSRNLLHRKITPVFTGKGNRDASLIAQICADLDGCINTCDKLNLGQLVALITSADLIYSVETSIGHIAAAFKKPVVAIYGGMADPIHWKPYGESVLVASLNLSCSPCFIKNGCSHRRCLSELDVCYVEETANKLLNNSKYS